MRVKFLVDYGGKFGGELPFKAGNVAELGEGAAAALVARGMAIAAPGAKLSEIKYAEKPKPKAKVKAKK
jgi:hypothetical protein